MSTENPPTTYFFYFATYECCHPCFIVHFIIFVRELNELLLAYGPQPSYDDMAWYGLAYTRIYEVF